MSVGVAWTVDRVCEGGIAPGPPPRLLDHVRAAIRARHYGQRTEKAYVHWIRRYILFHGKLFHGKRHPETLGAAEIESFLSALAAQGRVAASTQNQALAALLFLYREVLRMELLWIDGIMRADDAEAAECRPRARRHWVIPASRHDVDRETRQRRRHHLHETVLQRAVREATIAARLTC